MCAAAIDMPPAQTHRGNGFGPDGVTQSLHLAVYARVRAGARGCSACSGAGVVVAHSLVPCTTSSSPRARLTTDRLTTASPLCWCWTAADDRRTRRSAAGRLQVRQDALGCSVRRSLPDTLMTSRAGPPLTPSTPIHTFRPDCRRPPPRPPCKYCRLDRRLRIRS